MHLFAVDLSSATGFLTELEASFSSFLVSGSSSRTESQVFVDDVDIDAFAVINKHTPVWCGVRLLRDHRLKSSPFNCLLGNGSFLFLL